MATVIAATRESAILYDFRANYFSDSTLWDRSDLDSSFPHVREALSGAGPDLRTNLADASALTRLRRFILRDVFAERRAAAGLKYESNLAFILPGLTPDDFWAAEDALERLGNIESGLLYAAMRASSWRSGSRAVRPSGRKYAVHDPWIPMRRSDRAWLLLIWHLTWEGEGREKLAEHWRHFANEVDPPTWWRKRYGARALDLWPGRRREPSAAMADPSAPSGEPIINVIAPGRRHAELDDFHMRLTRPAAWEKALGEHIVNAEKTGRKDGRLHVKTVQETLLKVVALTYRRLHEGHQLLAGPPEPARPRLPYPTAEPQHGGYEF